VAFGLGRQPAEQVRSRAVASAISCSAASSRPSTDRASTITISLCTRARTAASLGRQPAEQIRSHVSTDRRLCRIDSCLGRQPAEQIRSLPRATSRRHDQATSSCLGRQPAEQVRSRLFAEDLDAVTWSRLSKHDHRYDRATRSRQRLVSALNWPSKYDHPLAASAIDMSRPSTGRSRLSICWSRPSTGRASTITRCPLTVDWTSAFLGCIWSRSSAGRASTITRMRLPRSRYRPCLGRQPAEQVRSRGRATAEMNQRLSRPSTGRASTITRLRGRPRRERSSTVSAVNRPSKYDRG
jgi:hypothetical protein